MSAFQGIVHRNHIPRTLLPGMTEGGPDLRVTTGEHLQVVHSIAPAGTVIPLHHHVAEQLTYIIRGRIEVVIGGETYTAGPGDVVVVPGNVPHEFRIFEEMEAIEAVSPIRPELIATGE